MQEREGGEPPNQEDYERAPPEQRAHQAHGMHEREWRGPPNQEDNEGAPPDQRAISVHGMQDREGEGTPDQEAEEGAPPQQRVLPAHGMQERGEVRGTPHQEGEGGATPEQESMPFVHGLIQEMGVIPQPPRPAEAQHRQTKRCGGGRIRGTIRTRSWRGHTSTIREEGYTRGAG